MKAKIFDGRSFLIEHHIPFSTEGPNNAPGWINIKCPFCDDRSDHMGFSLHGGGFHCWRCGTHTQVDTIQRLLGCSQNDAIKILKQYRTISTNLKSSKREFREVSYGKTLSLPTTATKLSERHRRYLENRNYDPDELEETWGLLGTSHLDPDYPLRIIAPVTYQTRLVTFHSRDITGLRENPHKACKPEDELIHHKNLLYGFDHATKYNRVVVVEGMPDVWRMGPGSVSTFGIEFTPSQVLLLTAFFDEIFILYDPEDQAQAKAEEMKSMIELVGKTAHRLNIEWDGDTHEKVDPGVLDPDLAGCLMKDLGLQ